MFIFKVLKEKINIKNITFQMKDTAKKINSKIKSIKRSFSAGKITQYSGLVWVGDFIKKHNLEKQFDKMFPTRRYNATKFSNTQVLLSFIFGFFSGINRISRISNFTQDELVKSMLNLSTRINKDALSNRLKKLGETGARKLRDFQLQFNAKYLEKSKLAQITLDADSTVMLSYGNQQGAEKGYNPQKPGAKSYHPLLVFVSELKLLYHSIFRKGSAYTSNGIIDLLEEIKAGLPARIKKVFFRADSGFYSEALMSYIESIEGWDYLIKIKFRGLKALLEAQQWEKVQGVKGVEMCEFKHISTGGKERTIKAIRTIKEVEEDFLGTPQQIIIYQYAAYASNLDLDAYALHNKYKERATSETWIEQVKSQLMAGKTYTQDFASNDLLWQLSVWAYNISVMLRSVSKKFLSMEHASFRDLFILVAGKIVKSNRQWHIKMYKHYFYKGNWLELERLLQSA